MGTFKITKKINFENKTKENLKKAQIEFDKQLQLHASKIKINTDEGKTFDDKNLKDYKDSTKKQRAKLGLQVSPPNLTQTGAMLKAITSKTEKNLQDKFKGQIFIRNIKTSNFRDRKNTTSTVDKAQNVIKLGFRFFGISKKDVNSIQEAIKSTFIKGWNK
jgi:hypothetical protein